ncbi:MAG: riboflavin biosynthesis protein RibF [Candidatus Omnitrophica bacterium]|nr:riboflavin biosynthesis protein RibF [Candidatus Omnitrophota bacterium]
MKIIYGINQVKRYAKPVVALGVFDGVHIGHRVVLKAAVKKANDIGGTAMAVTFYPHPQGEGSLHSLEHRLRLVAELGIDVCVIINFSRAFAKVSAQDFIKNILVRRLNTYYVYVGSNFRFGRGASGDFKLLEKLSGIYGFRLKAFNVIKAGTRNISSTYIRRLISKGNLRMAQRLLGRPVSVFGTVVRGVSFGRKLGFPTANIDPHHEVLPPSGIYACRVILGKDKLNGVCYIGRQPEFLMKNSHTSRKNLKHVEVHIFNFNKPIYGKELEIQFLKKIRKERRFASPGPLAAQIKKDVKVSRKILSRH